MTKIIIRADANTQIGIGHVMRCIALGQAWKKKGGRVIFISACESKNLKNRITDEGFELVPHEKPCPDPDDLLTTLAIINNQTTTNDWIVLDGYHFDTDYQQSIKKNGNSILVIDDIAQLKHYYADILINQNLHAEELNYSCEPYTKLLLGTKYVLLRSEFLRWQGWKRKIPDIAHKVLVTLGGSDPDNVTLKVIDVLQHVKVEGLEVIVVVGGNNPHYKELQSAVRGLQIPIRLERNVANISELMAWADMAITGGGSTIWELAFMKLPSFVAIIAENQRLIVEDLAKKDCLLGSGWIKDFDIKFLKEEFKKFILNKNFRKRINHKIQILVDGKGLFRVLKLIKLLSK